MHTLIVVSTDQQDNVINSRLGLMKEPLKPFYPSNIVVPWIDFTSALFNASFRCFSCEYYNSRQTKNVKNLECVLKYCSTNIHGPVKYLAQTSHLPQRALNHKSLLQTNEGSSIIAAALCAADVCIDWKTKCLISSGLSRCFTQENKNICNDRGLCLW